MKVHMLKMHQINMDEHPEQAAGASTIGGVTCDICQKELCSKYFLKVHKQNTHGIYEDNAGKDGPGSRGGSGGRQPSSSANSVSAVLSAAASNENNNSRANSSPPNTSQQQPLAVSLPMIPVSLQQHLGMMMSASHLQPPPPPPNREDSQEGIMSNSDMQFPPQPPQQHQAQQQEKDPKSQPQEKESSKGIDPKDSSNRYFSHYTEVCPLCERRFKSIKWLKTHIINDHSDIYNFFLSFHHF